MFGRSKTNPIFWRFIALFAVLILATCTPNPSSPTPVPTHSPIPSNSPVPTMVLSPTSEPTETPLPVPAVDASTMEHKLLMGYQGWFTCPGDGSKVNGYFHWFKSDVPDAANFRVDMWPDTSELTPDERCQTKMVFPNGQPAYLYSAYNPKTVMRHFEWMSQYGIDGVFLQRFGSGTFRPGIF